MTKLIYFQFNSSHAPTDSFARNHATTNTIESLVDVFEFNRLLQTLFLDRAITAYLTTTCSMRIVIEHFGHAPALSFITPIHKNILLEVATNVRTL